MTKICKLPGCGQEAKMGPCCSYDHWQAWETIRDGKVFSSRFRNSVLEPHIWEGKDRYRLSEYLTVNSLIESTHG
jgi:hypothetical protein